MEITVETNCYNQRRYGKPWVAKVDFSQSTKGDYAWGNWTGDHYNGGEGVLSINVNIGDIIAQGQKDLRKPRNSAPDFFVVNSDGSLDEIGDKGAAYKRYLTQRDASPDITALEKEKETLLARIAEIDNLLGQ